MRPQGVTLNWDGRKPPAEGGATAGPVAGGATARPVAGGAAARPVASYATEDGASWLLQGENLGILRSLARTQAGSVTLAYLDPPFFTNREHAAMLRKAGAPRGSARVRAVAFDDRWSDLSAFLDTLGARLDAVRELLAPHGSIVVHVDPKTSHYVKVLGDEIFGAAAFASEIVWRYRRWPSKTPNFQRVHDVLLRWRKDLRVEPRWNQPYEPLAASTLATWGTNKQRAVFTKDGRRARSSSTAEATAGVPMGDVWEIGVIAPVAKERTGYPSQKPEILLERLVRALSDEGDRVLDPYAGSGTSLAVAHRMGRCFLGVDSSPVALEVARARLDAIGAPVAEKCDRDGCGALPPTADHLTRNLAFRALPGNTR